jgi:hypothetical protein
MLELIARKESETSALGKNEDEKEEPRQGTVNEG